jgi:peptide/nickel transport system substrate-binding protein
MKRFFIAALVIILAAGCSSAPTAVPVKRMTVAMPVDDLLTLDPHRAYEHTNTFINYNTYDTLVEFYPPDMVTLHPALADSWKVSDDGLEYTFSLHPGVKFPSGNVLNAEDVRFSWARLANLKGNPSFYATGIDTITVVDDLTLRVRLKSPSPAFLSSLAAPAMAVLDKSTLQQHGAVDQPGADTEDAAGKWLDQNSAGTGPYVLYGWKPKEEITLVANTNSWREAPAFGRVTIRHISSQAGGLELLRGGKVEILAGLDPAGVKSLQGDTRFTLPAGPTLNMLYLAMSPDPALGGPLADKKVRQAVAAAIDRAGMAAELSAGQAGIPPSVIPLGIVPGQAGVGGVADPAKARALLAEAGFKDKTLELTMAFSSDPSSLAGAAAARMQADLKAVGINLALKPLSGTDFLAEMRARKLPMALGVWSPDYADLTMWTDYFSYPDRGISYRVGYANPLAAEQADIVAGSSDPAARQAAANRLAAIWADDAAVIPLFQPGQAAAVSSTLAGFEYHPVFFCDLSMLTFGR